MSHDFDFDDRPVLRPQRSAAPWAWTLGALLVAAAGSGVWVGGYWWMQRQGASPPALPSAREMDEQTRDIQAENLRHRQEDALDQQAIREARVSILRHFADETPDLHTTREVGPDGDRKRAEQQRMYALEGAERKAQAEVEVARQAVQIIEARKAKRALARYSKK